MPSAVVVGAGVFGAALADRLASEGFEVTLVERVEPGHPGAESGGEGRLLRFSHGPDEPYTRSAWRANELWRELEDEVGEELVVKCGLFWFARSADGWEAESEGVLRGLGVPAERMRPEDGAERFPSLDCDDMAFVLHEPEAGVLRAAAATRALAERAGRRGARVVRGEAHPAGDGVDVSGERMHADLVAWCCGAWLARLFPGLVELRVTRQDIVFFAAPAEWASPPLPAWADYDGAAYGHGTLDGHGMKVALDFDGPPLDDPGARPEEASAESVRASAEYLAHRFPALAGAPVERTKVCHYSMTGDMGFICDRHPEHERVWLVGGGSGHGFKHGPAFAELATAILTGREPRDQRFALGPRKAGRSLRTAGWSGSGG